MSYTPQTWTDLSGLEITAAHLNYIEAGIAGAYDFQPGETFTILKDPVTGFWPSSWSGRVPSYSGGAVDSGVRPTARTDVYCHWQGPDPSPAVVSSGTGGMLTGVDSRYVTP